ncbi:hypothetical protein CLOM_g16169 [Closterium sp. NIES-68]|nr:hypothetical protein CLOM_g16169 [Closterium sp. NIES-68]GJP72319.1 hypothetical protein CLOP_g3063 [Closterium sp. NIES-67]
MTNRNVHESASFPPREFRPREFPRRVLWASSLGRNLLESSPSPSTRGVQERHNLWRYSDSRDSSAFLRRRRGLDNEDATELASAESYQCSR